MFESRLELAVSKLSYSNPNIRKSGAQHLAKNPPASKLRVIQNAFAQEENPGVIKWLALALGRIGDRSSKLLINNKKEELNRETIKERDAHDWLVVAENKIMETTSSKEIQSLLESNYEGVQKKGALLSWGKPFIPKSNQDLLIENAKSESPEVRRWSLLTLDSVSGFDSADPIIEVAEDSNYLVAEWAEFCISNIEDPDAIPVLITNLTHSHPRVREWAIKALGVYPNKDICKILINRYEKEEDTLCKEAIVEAVQPWIGQNEVNRFLLQILTSEQSILVLQTTVRVISEEGQIYRDSQLMEAVRETVDRLNSVLLAREIEAGLVENVSDEELDALMKVVESPKLRTLGRFSALNTKLAARTDFNSIEAQNDMDSGTGTPTIFIAHGQSLMWRELKDMLVEDLDLQYEEFNRTPVAGRTITDRLREMLDSADFAFMVMTAEDVHEDDELHARENVIHEAGLFQGRLGFEKAIILLEENCSEFSNIHGLGQIRFNKDDISSCFHEVKTVLEREHII